MITVPLDHCSSRSYLEVPLDHIKKSSNKKSLVIDSSADAVTLDRDKKLPMSDDSDDSELEVSETQCDESGDDDESNVDRGDEQW